ncbi:MAG: acyl-CoA thioesterase [Spirochaetes bacterium]|nr:acyl-CoA thioesterase [Spirochaetota bacterium]MBU0954143.1 acyl-CoA thioesterase [Spirochaetota bacterium]
MSQPFTVSMQVRDYELDMQGIVNNSVYQNYLEHARHEYLKSIGLDFADFARRGINLVVFRAELDYKASLTSGDTFTISVRMVRESRLKFAFLQDIVRSSDNKAIMSAKIIGTALAANGRPEIPPELDLLLD